jgi:hypothetical protein
MKKLLYLLLLSNISTAQNAFKWADSAAVWHLSSGSMLGLGYQKMVYEKDSIINNKHCQKISRMSQIRQQTGPGTFAISPLMFDASYFLYKSNDSIFSYHDNQFFLAFKTNGIVGEIWDLGKLYINDTIQHACVKVDSVFYQSYNGQSLRNIKIHACDMNGDSIVYNGPNPDSALTALIAPGYIGSIINEKFGPLQGFNGINFAYPNFGIIEYMPATMLCYQSATFPFHQFQNEDCFNNIFVGVEEQSMGGKIDFFPNPASNQMSILNHEGETIVIADLSGKVIFQKQLNQNTETINIENLANGMYMVNVGLITRKLIKN